MPNSNQAIVSLLTTHAHAGQRELDVAILLAQSMVRELRATVTEWENAVIDLNAIKEQNLMSAN